MEECGETDRSGSERPEGTKAREEANEKMREARGTKGEEGHEREDVTAREGQGLGKNRTRTRERLERPRVSGEPNESTREAREAKG